MPPRAVVWDRGRWGLALPGWEQQPAPPRAARKGRQPPRGRQGCFRKRRTRFIHTEQQEVHWERVGQPAAGRAASHVCWARPPLSCLSCWGGAASSSGNSSSSSVHGTRSSRGARRSSHQNQPWSYQGAQALHSSSKTLGCPGDRGTHGAQQMLASLALWEPICAGEAQQLSCQRGWWRCGDRVAELTASSLAFPIPAFPSPRARGSWCPAQPLPRECLWDAGATLVCRQSHYKITRLEAGTHQIQPWNRGYSLAAAKKRSKERRWLSMAQPQEALPQVHAVTQMLAEVAQCREVTRAARRPPPLRWQSPDGCSFPGTGRLRRVGRRRAGRAAGKSQPGRQRGEQMVRPAGERRHLPARAGSQGHGAAPCRHPRALPGRGGSGARGLHTPHLLPLPKTRMSSLRRGSKHRIGQRVRPERSGRWEDVGAMPPPRSLAEAGSAVCLQALSRKVFLEGH